MDANGKSIYKVLSPRDKRDPKTLYDTFYIKGPDEKRVIGVFLTQYARFGYIIEIMPDDHPFEFEC